MNVIASLKARFPRILPVAVVVALGSIGGLVTYERLSGDCCYPGSPCCHPGSPCCASHQKPQQ